MTTSPVVSVTDELIDQLSALTYIDQGGAVLIHSDQVLALIAERAELKRDAERLEFVVNQGGNYQWMNIIRVDPDDFDSVRAAIDAAMQS